jgi:hypothetical protein
MTRNYIHVCIGFLFNLQEKSMGEMKKRGYPVGISKKIQLAKQTLEKITIQN